MKDHFTPTETGNWKISQYSGNTDKFFQPYLIIYSLFCTQDAAQYTDSNIYIKVIENNTFPRQRSVLPWTKMTRPKLFCNVYMYTISQKLTKNKKHLLLYNNLNNAIKTHQQTNNQDILHINCTTENIQYTRGQLHVIGFTKIPHISGPHFHRDIFPLNPKLKLPNYSPVFSWLASFQFHDFPNLSVILTNCELYVTSELIFQEFPGQMVVVTLNTR